MHPVWGDQPQVDVTKDVSDRLRTRLGHQADTSTTPAVCTTFTKRERRDSNPDLQRDRPNRVFRALREQEFSSVSCGDLRALPGVSGDLGRDLRGMEVAHLGASGNWPADSLPTDRPVRPSGPTPRPLDRAAAFAVVIYRTQSWSNSVPSCGLNW